MTKQLVYTAPYETKEDRKAVRDLRDELYEKYNSVQIYVNGQYEVKIVAEDEKTTIL